MNLIILVSLSNNKSVMDIIVKVVFPLPNYIFFSYKIDSQILNDQPIIGRRVFAELGRKKLTGYIIDIEENTNLKNIKYITELLDEKPILTENLLKLSKWISDYYICSLGEVIKATLPQGFSPKSLLNIELVRFPNEDELNLIIRKAPKRAELLLFLSKHKSRVSISHLQRVLKSNFIAPQIEALEKSGYIKIHTSIDKPLKTKTLKGYTIPAELLQDESKLKATFDALDKLKGKQKDIFLKIYTNFKKSLQPTPKNELVKAELFNQNNTKHLLDNGYITETTIHVSSIANDSNENLSEIDESLLPLTDEQNLALNQIVEAVDSEKFKVYLLHGVTGGGKTLIYINTIKKILSKNKTALLLVPEISLTPQLIDRFHKIFPDVLAVQHSRMSERERYDNWKSISEGKSKLVIGARSAIFAPLENIGVIIIDEEHEPTYKQDNPSPRYNARDVAVVRAKYENAIVILGSATPSLESMYNALSGKYELLKIEKRADGAELPVIKIVNTIAERKNQAMTGSFSDILIKKIIDRIDRKEGVILFLNRRGFASYLCCPDCGSVPMCKHCSVTLTYHKVKNYLRCHYCGYAIEAYKNCPTCGYPELLEVGTGTQRIEEELRSLLANYNNEVVIERIDLDSTSKRGSLRKKLYDFYKGKINILIGTQMLAKGLDFDIVTLVGVINPDIQLYLPDFRASERTFQLITQVSGRAGRASDKPGEVIIQTASPNSHSIICAVENNYYKFYNGEIENRKLAKYPPFSRFIVIEFHGSDEKKVIYQAKLFRAILPKSPDFADILGPVTPTIFKIKNKYRQHIIIKNFKDKDIAGNKIRNILSKALENYNKKYSNKSIKVIIDIDSWRGL